MMVIQRNNSIWKKKCSEADTFTQAMRTKLQPTDFERPE